MALIAEWDRAGKKTRELRRGVEKALRVTPGREDRGAVRKRKLLTHSDWALAELENKKAHRNEAIKAGSDGVLGSASD